MCIHPGLIYVLLDASTVKTFSIHRKEQWGYWWNEEDNIDPT
jgi:hypothetical protein